MSSSRLPALSSERMPSEALRTAMGSPSRSDAALRDLPDKRGETPSGSNGGAAGPREAARRAEQVADARVTRGVALERGRAGGVAAQQPGAVGTAHELVALRELAQRRRHRRP